MKYLAQWGKRMLSLMLGVMLMLCGFTVPAMAQDDWSALMITLSWTDANGNAYSATATPVDGSDQTFWAQLDGSASFDSLTLYVSHPYHADYVFSPSNGSVISAMDTGSAMDMTNAVTIMAYEADGVTFADAYTLYVSTQMAPVVEPTEAPTEIPTEIPTEAPTDTPVPVPETADVQVIYQADDGTTLGSTVETVATGTTATLWAADFDGYTASTSQQDVTVDAMGNPSMNPVIFYYSKVVTPEPAPTEVEITVVYVTTDGGNLGSTSVMAPTGQTTAVSAADFDGYTPDAYEKYVTVDASGNPDQNPVMFTYTANETPVPAPETVTVDVQYVTSDGTLLGTSQVSCLAGESVPVEAPSYDGYTVNVATQTVTVSEDGIANPSVVVFTYTAVEQPTEIPAAEVRVTIRYVDADDGHEVASSQTSDVLAEGPNNITAAPADLADGYSIVSEPNATVDVSGGVADSAEVVFYYRAAAVVTDEPVTPVSATINVFYQDTNGADIADPMVETLEGGTTSVVAPQADHVPAGYKAYQADPVSVTVSVDGVADRDSVTFIYEQEVVETPIPVGETINRFGETNATQVKFRSEPSKASNKNILATLSKGTKVWMVKDQVTDAGETWTQVIYNGTSGYIMSDLLTVMTEAESEQYEAEECETPVPREPVEVVTPTPEPETVTREITALYQLADGTLLDSLVTTYNETDSFVTFNKRDFAGYTADQDEIVVAIVNGVAEQSTVTFTYTAIPGEVSVTVQYVDQDGALLGEIRTACNTGASTTVYAANFEGYTADANSKTVTVDANGNPDQNPVIFTYTKNTPVVTETPAPYTGYAVTTSTVALRTEISTADTTIITTLPENTLINITAQSIDSASSSVWSRGTTLDNQQGYVPDSALRHITAQEAKYYIDQWNDAHATATPATATSEPPQTVGYAYTVGDGVYFRTQASTTSQIISVLSQNIPLLVMGQVYDANNVAWHIVNYNGVYGYIRADLLRMMTAQEIADYTENLKKGTPTPVPSSTPQPYNEQSLSSYGYVTTTSVNFRKSASTSSTKVGTLKQYALCLILGTEEVNGQTWYHISYNNTTGYVMGNYFKQMTIEEVQSFLTSDEYKKGISNNSSSSSSSSTNSGTNTSGTVPSAEDSTVEEWKSNSALNVSYEPFDPFATVAPLATTEAPTSSPTVSPTTSELPEPVETTEEPVATIEISDPDDNSDSGSSIGWIIGVLIALVCIGGGVYGYIVYSQNKKRAAQQRAAAKRAAAQRSNAPQGQMRPGYPQNGQQRNPNGTTAQAQNPYARNGQRTSASASASSSTYRRPEVKAAPDVTGMRNTTGDRSAQQTGRQSVNNAQGTRSTYGQNGGTNTASGQQRYNAYRPTETTSGTSQQYSSSYRPQSSANNGTASQQYTANYHQDSTGETERQQYTASYRQDSTGETDRQQYTASYRNTDETASNGANYTPRRRRTQAANEELKNQDNNDL